MSKDEGEDAVMKEWGENECRNGQKKLMHLLSCSFQKLNIRRLEQGGSGVRGSDKMSRKCVDMIKKAYTLSQWGFRS